MASQFFAFNPALLDDAELWSYRDLQLLAIKVGQGGGGSRQRMVQKLTDWHRRQTPAQAADPAPAWPNVGSNFQLMPVDLGIDPTDMLSPGRAQSSPGRAAAAAQVSPLVMRHGGTTPLKSALRKKSAYSPTPPKAGGGGGSRFPSAAEVADGACDAADGDDDGSGCAIRTHNAHLRCLM